MRLPHADQAQVDIRKLCDYTLNPDHPEGKHKARLFASILNLTAEDAEMLQDLLLSAVLENDAQPGKRDSYGQRYTVDFVVKWRGRTAVVRSGWILEYESTRPRLTTCFPI